MALRASRATSQQLINTSATAAQALAGGDFFTDLDELRADAAGARLRTVAGLPARTALGLAHRFDDGQVAGLRAAQGELARRYYAALPRYRRRELAASRPTVDIDPTDVEVYGKFKERIGWSYAGMRAGRPIAVTWANAGLPLTSRLLAGDEDVKPIAPALIAESIAALPDGLRRPIVRADSGLFSGAVARAALANEADFAIAAPRNVAVRRAIGSVPASAWRKAKRMPGAQVAAATYRSDGWPVDTYLVVRRYPVRATEISADPRARRRRSFDPAQLHLALDGKCDTVYAYVAFVTNLTGDPVELEAWFRDRAHVEERIKDAKLGMPLRHLPSGVAAANEVWLAAVLLALSLSVAVQALTNHDDPHRAHGKRLRRELIRIPGRVIRHAAGLAVRLAPGHPAESFISAYDLLYALPSPAG